ncbi:MAG: enoyl-CoA hydratase [Arenicellales bacterium]|jgi:enoyl-CoA hydratase
MAYSTIVSEIHDNVGLIRLNRPKALNALSTALMIELGEALNQFEENSDIGAIVITGNEKAFAAGADIVEMKDKSFMDVYKQDFITDNWEQVTHCRKPVIAAVSGYALGGGCELAMMCDFILAADNARFGQPEINLGIIPGAGGTQRLTRAIGKAKAMELCLTGRLMDADEAERAGLVARIVPVDQLLDDALKTAGEIAAKSLPSVMMCKESVNRSFETTLSEGLLFERRQFHALFATEDQKEGMSAFAEKRKAEWQQK